MTLAATLWLAVAAQVAPPEAPPGATRFHGALEVSVMSLGDLFLDVTPILGVDGGDDFAFELGAALNLLVAPRDAATRQQEYGKVLRREDWSEPSDFGQILRQLRIGSDASRLQLRAGPLSQETLGWGHLVNRYDDRLNVNYHPSGTTLAAFLGPTRAEVLVSDLLGARLFAGQVALDLGRLFGATETWVDRLHLTGSLAYDAARAGGAAPKLGVAALDADLALFRSSAVQLFLEVGSGGRIDVSNASVSGAAGLAVDGHLPSGLLMSGKLELRKQQGSFRFGMFGPGYELARFSDVGLAQTPLAQAALPDGFSAYAEASLALDGKGPDASGLHASASAEHFSWGRTDLDAAVTLALGRLARGTARLIAADVGGASRLSAQAELRWRLAAAFYALGYVGNAYFPQGDGSLARDFFGGVGAAVDFER